MENEVGKENPKAIKAVHSDGSGILTLTLPKGESGYLTDRFGNRREISDRTSINITFKKVPPLEQVIIFEVDGGKLPYQIISHEEIGGKTSSIGLKRLFPDELKKAISQGKKIEKAQEYLTDDCASKLGIPEAS